MYNTGARVSEILSLRAEDISYEKPASIRIEGKGRKKRRVPLWSTTAKLLQKWSVDLSRNSSLFTNRNGEVLSRSGVEARLDIMVKKASENCLSIAKKNVSPHTFRHSTAMHLLEAGVDITMIAMWLGHASIKTTHGYVEADVAMKAKALEAVQAPEHRGKRYKPSDTVLAFLEGL
jgi:integrase/recombinase XerD